MTKVVERGDKALKGINSNIRQIQSSLRDVNRLLKLDPKNTTLLSQKKKLLKESIGQQYRILEDRHQLSCSLEHFRAEKWN